MATIQTSYHHVGELLLDPLPQRPTVKQRFGSLLREMQNFQNELGNTSQNWTNRDFTLNLNASQTDYAVSNSERIGKILFVSLQYDNPYYEPVEFADLSDISNDWWYYNQIDRPFDDGYFSRSGARIAFYRKDGGLYVKTARNYYFYGNLIVTAATGDWSSSAELSSSPVLSSYHHLPEIRAALNLLPACQWSFEVDKRELKASLLEQESRVLEQFKEAKRNMTADYVTFRGDAGDDY